MTEGPYKLPEGWRWVRLGEVCEVLMGQSPPSSTYNHDSIGLPFFQGKADFGELHPTPRVWCTKPMKIAEAGDILISVRAPVGPTNLAKERCCIGRGLAALRAGHKVQTDWVLFYLRSIEQELGQSGSGSTFNAITKKELSAIPIPLPPLDAQRRIVARIEALMSRMREAKRLRQQAKEDAERLMQAALAEVFPRLGAEPPPGWRWVRLGEVCEVWDTLRKPVKKKDRIPGDVPYCGANGIIDYVDGYTHAGEFVLLAEDGGFYGPGEPTAYIMSGRFWANNHVHILRGRPDHLVNQLLYYCLVAYDLRPFLTGATRPKLTQAAMRSIPIPLPPLDEQRWIVAHLEAVQEKVRALKEAQAETDEELKRLERSILDKAFRGEL